MPSIILSIFSFFTFSFACIGVAFVGYSLYQRYKNRDQSNTHQDFEANRAARQQREEQISEYATQSTLRLHGEAHQILANYKEQQAHFGSTLEAFDLLLEDISHNNLQLDNLNNSVQDTVLQPMKLLLDKIRAHYADSCSLISFLSEALIQSAESIKTKEQEMQIIIQDISTTQVEFQNGVSTLMGLVNTVQLKADYIKKLEEKNRALESALADAVRDVEILLGVCESKSNLLNSVLKSDASSYDCRLFGNGSPDIAALEQKEEDTSVENTMGTAM
ncbi:MAG: hypothetical protein CK423_06885 [Legionella sp.]|nr:MAG: hypothetical protein CK423_06885 [Legionella sp.]